MNKKVIGIIVGLVVVGGLVAGWFLFGRYAVEGGKVVWAARYQEQAALEEAIAAGPEQEALDEALRISVSDGNRKAAKMLVDAGAAINPTGGNACLIAGTLTFGRIDEAALALELGADPTKCEDSPSDLLVDLVRTGHDEAPQSTIIEVAAPLLEAGADPTAVSDVYKASALQLAEKHELDKVVAFLKNPSDQKVADRGEKVDRPTGKAGAVELDDLKSLCEGEAQPDTAPYEASDDYAASVFYFEKRFDEWRYPGRNFGVTLPEWWTTFDEPANAQLVVCVDMSDKTKVETCQYRGEGGGINRYKAKVTFELRESKTGKVVEKKDLGEKMARACPTLKSGKEQEGLYPSYDEELKAFLKPHVGGPE